MDWDRAVGHFQKCLELAPKDYLPRMYVKRCEFLRENPPETVDGHWNGVWILDGK